MQHEDLLNDFEEETAREEQTQQAISDVMHELIDELSLGTCFETHRACRMGMFLLDETDEEAQKQYEIVDGKGVDVFGQIPMKKQYECICPNCQRNLAASRFAPHLEKCMGMGRNSSRLASRRLITKPGAKDSDNDSEDNDNDQDWSYLADKRAKKLRKEKNPCASSPRRTKSSKAKNGIGDIPSVGSTASDGSGSNIPAPYEGMTPEERKAALIGTCGVVSEHTKKTCTRSLRCPQHTDEQRRAIRQVLLGPSGPADCDDMIDIEQYDDADSQVLRDTLQWEAASNPSPADSTSTTGSNSRKRKSKHGKKKGSSSKHSGGGGGGGGREGGGGSVSGTSTPVSLYEFH